MHFSNHHIILYSSDFPIILFFNFRDTLNTLREVENFLKIPCYDFSAISLPNTNPLKKLPETFFEKVKKLLRVDILLRNKRDDNFCVLFLFLISILFSLRKQIFKFYFLRLFNLFENSHYIFSTCRRSI